MKQNILCLDWSNLAFRSLYMANGFGSSCSYNNQEEINNYIAKMAQDLALILRIFNPAKVVFAADSKHSWRKDVLDTYKSNRVKSETINWDNVYGALDKFKQHLKNIGFVFVETEHAEADDLMALTKELVFNDPDFKNYNLMLVSADADIRQLIEFKESTEQYCFVFNEIGRGPGGKRHIYTDQKGINWYNNVSSTTSIFNMTINMDRQYLQNIIANNKKIVIEATDPANILLSKIFCGDDGDAVPAFYDWYGNKGNKVRITNSKFVKILGLLNVHNIDDMDLNVDSLKETIETVIKREITDIDVKERYMRQKKLVQLKSDIFPDFISSYKPTIKTLILNESIPALNDIKMKDLLKDCDEFNVILQKDRTKNADVFKGLNKYIDNLNLEKLF
jgi:hypothetical protein